MERKLVEIPEFSRIKDAYFKMKDVKRLRKMLINVLSNYAKLYVDRIVNHQGGWQLNVLNAGIQTIEFVTNMAEELNTHKAVWVITGGSYTKAHPFSRLKDGRYMALEEVAVTPQGEMNFRIDKDRTIALNLNHISSIRATHFWRFEVYTKQTQAPAIVLTNVTLKDELEHFVPIAINVEKYLADKARYKELMHQLERSFEKLGGCRGEVNTDSLVFFFPKPSAFLQLEIAKDPSGKRQLFLNGVSLEGYFKI